MMDYPIPYPPLQQQQQQHQQQQEQEQEQEQGGDVQIDDSSREHRGNEGAGRGLATRTQTPPPKRTKLFTTPFRAPRPVTSKPSSRFKLSPTPTLASSPTPIVTSNSFPLPLPTPLNSPTSALQRPFKPPSVSSPSAVSSTSHPAVGTTSLERRVHLLRQAVKHRNANVAIEKDGETELQALCDKWKETGKAAARMLSGVVRGSTNDSGVSSSSYSQRSGGRSWAGGSGEPSESNWEYSSSPLPCDLPLSSPSDFEDSSELNSNSNRHSLPFTSPSTTSSSPSPSWGWSTSFSSSSSSSPHIDTESTSDFLLRIDRIAKTRGTSRNEVLKEIEGKSIVLETAEEIYDSFSKKSKGKLAKKKKGE